MVNTGRHAAYSRRNAQILLLADQSEHGPARSDAEIAETVGITTVTVENIRKRLVLKGMESALTRAKRSRERSQVLDGDAESKLITIACSTAPDGRNRWTLRMLADEMVKRKIVRTVSHEAVRQTLKKQEVKPWLEDMWCIPPSEDASFICSMEQVLDVYKRPQDPLNPLVCMDEKTMQCVKEVRVPQPTAPGHPARYDGEYERNGVAHLLMFYAPLNGWRRVDLKTDHKAVTWAKSMRKLVEEDYPEANRITVVMDNLNTHTGASLYKTFPPEQARKLMEKLEFVYTPKHGSWLNSAESELSVISRQCLNRRLPDIETAEREIAAWVKHSNEERAPTKWQFFTEDARIKLHSIYPRISDRQSTRSSNSEYSSV